MQTLEKSTLTYGDIHVHWPYGKIRLDKLELIQQAGAHGRLSFSGWVDEEWEETIIQKAGSHDRVGFIQIDESGRELPLFKGQLHEIKVEATRGIVYVMAVVISHTYELDALQRTKSYQNENLRYLDIVNRVMKGYPEGDYIDFAFDETKTGAFIMQYQETDWSFLKRLASHLGADLVPDVTAHKPRFWIGYPEGRGAFELKAIPFEKSRNIERFLHTEAQGKHAVTEAEYTTYTFDLGQELQLGDEVSSDGRIYNITSRQAMLERSLLQWKYTCALPASHPLPRQLQTMITGAAIEGKIIDVKRNQVKVHLDMDEGQQAGEARWFPYAAEGSQVWYMMPEPGAKVKLYFPSAEEDEAMVMQSVRQEPTEAGHVEKSGKVMQDPGVKSFGNPQGKSFTLGDSELVMNAQEGALYISMAAGNGVTLNSTTHVQIQCMGDLNISGASVSLEGTEGLYIQTMTDHVELVEEVNGKSENVVLEAEIHRSFDMIQSAFDQSLASMGESALKEARLKRNWEAREKGKLDGVIEEGKSLLSMVGDVADLAFTGIVGGDNAQGLYSWVKGEEVGSLTERNATVQGTITGVNNVIDYTGDLVTGQKSGKEIWQDVSGAGEAYAKPFMDLKGEDNRTMLTLKEQESYDAGRNDVNAAVRVVDTVTAVAGGASLVKNGVKVLKGGSKKSGHADGDGAKGGVPHGHGDGPDGASGGAMKDGKLKTNAALMPSSLAELGERINQAMGKMTAGAAASVPWRVQRVRLSNGQTVPVIVKNDSHMFSDAGGNRGKGSGSGNSKGSPNTSHVDSRESSAPSKGTVSKESSKTSPNVPPVKPKEAPKPKEALSSKDGTKVRDGNTEGTGKISEVGSQADDILRDGSHIVDGELKPNVTYKTGEYEYIYKTDSKGRLEKFTADDLKLTERDSRLPHDPDTPGKEPGDHAGHLAGDRFGGSPEIDNLVSQLSNVNLSQYKKIENQWANAIKEGKKVKVNVEVKYDGDSIRPSKFNVQYEIDGEAFSKSILN
ncbi:DNA/RNA non-specific endonuclease [Paenibacillus sp. E222]|uniref:DNA/RNA non-specific endonuclease n=1 Tax=Paenibacillus sp. E222 TaxID=2748863 RepID=UPI0015C61946|nr:DNA/RNA non-specific endonuclease [Paenibacillus sp. E222]QLG37113.1 DNA/RNA non-specific endonuclease [Paenibacillus sp. E222]